MVDAGRVTVVVDTNTKNLNKGLKQAKTEVSKFGTTIKKMGIASTIGWAVAATAVTSFVKQSTLAAIEFEQRFSSFSRLVTGSANQMLRDLDQAAMGTVSNLQIVTQANNAILLGIQQEQLPQMMEAARVLGAAVGRTTEQAFADLAIGIGRQSRMILDNLGIIFRAEDAYRKYAESIGKSVDELSAAEKQLAASKGIMESIAEATDKLEGSVTDASTSLQQFTKEWADFKVEAGEVAIPVVTTALKGLNFQLRSYMDQLDLLKGEKGMGAQLAQILAPGMLKGLVPKAFPEIEMDAFPSGMTSPAQMLEGMKGVDITKYQEGLQAAKDVFQAEQEIQALIKEKDLTQIKNLMELSNLQKQYDDRRRAGIDELGSSFLAVLSKIRDEALSLDDDIRFGSKNQQSYAEFKSRRQEQIESGLLTPGGAS